MVMMNLNSSLQADNRKIQTEVLSLIDAAKDDDIDKLQDLIELGVDVNAVDEHGKTALIEAAYNGHIDAVKLLINNGANVNADKEGQTALVFAAMTAQVGIGKKAIDIAKEETTKIYYNFRPDLKTKQKIKSQEIVKMLESESKQK